MLVKHILGGKSTLLIGVGGPTDVSAGENFRRLQPPGGKTCKIKGGIEAIFKNIKRIMRS